MDREPDRKLATAVNQTGHCRGRAREITRGNKVIAGRRHMWIDMDRHVHLCMRSCEKVTDRSTDQQTEQQTRVGLHRHRLSYNTATCEDILMDIMLHRYSRSARFRSSAGGDVVQIPLCQTCLTRGLDSADIVEESSEGMLQVLKCPKGQKNHRSEITQPA